MQRRRSEVSGGWGAEEYGDVRETDAVLSGAAGDLYGHHGDGGSEGWRPDAVLGDGCGARHLKSGRGGRDVAINHSDVVVCAKRSVGLFKSPPPFCATPASERSMVRAAENWAFSLPF